MNGDQELKILKDKLSRQELLIISLRNQNKELHDIVKELNIFIENEIKKDLYSCYHCGLINEIKYSPLSPYGDKL